MAKTPRTLEEWKYKQAHGHWPKREPAVVCRQRRTLAGKTLYIERAELPSKQQGEQKMPLREIRRRIIAIKLERGCTDCGFRLHAAALDFDHVRGRKAVLLSQINVPYWSVVEHELAKCDVVCANCHRIRHANRRHRDKCKR